MEKNGKTYPYRYSKGGIDFIAYWLDGVGEITCAIDSWDLP